MRIAFATWALIGFVFTFVAWAFTKESAASFAASTPFGGRSVAMERVTKVERRVAS